jgi:3-oxoadipate enol-lactonase
MPELRDIGGGVRLACAISGNGPPLVLMHGAEGSHRMFDAIVPLLAKHFEVIAYDQRECGDTENPGTPATLADLADDASALLHALGHAKAHVYGTSFGGRVAQMLAHRHPNHVECLVLGSTWPLPVALEMLNPEGVREIYALQARLPESAEALANYFLPRPFLESHPELKGIFRNVQPQSECSRRRARTVADRPSLEPGAIAVPTLVLAGELDRVVPASVTMDMARAIPGAAFELLGSVGHAGALQVPEAIAERIRRFCLGPKTAVPGDSA